MISRNQIESQKDSPTQTRKFGICPHMFLRRLSTTNLEVKYKDRTLSVSFSEVFTGVKSIPYVKPKIRTHPKKGTAGSMRVPEPQKITTAFIYRNLKDSTPPNATFPP